jgi:hypothetical protein
MITLKRTAIAIGTLFAVTWGAAWRWKFRAARPRTNRFRSRR